jgi:hypothetical protein
LRTATIIGDIQTSFETTDPKLARRCRLAQFGWMKTTLSVDGSPVTGIVQSVKEIDRFPMRWIVTVVANQRVAA